VLLLLILQDIGQKHTFKTAEKTISYETDLGCFTRT